MKDQSLKKKKIAVLMGGISREREISLKTGKAILKALTEKGYPATSLDVREDITEQLVKEKIELAFLALVFAHSRRAVISSFMVLERGTMLSRAGSSPSKRLSLASCSISAPLHPWSFSP